MKRIKLTVWVMFTLSLFLAACTQPKVEQCHNETIIINHTIETVREVKTECLAIPTCPTVECTKYDLDSFRNQLTQCNDKLQQSYIRIDYIQSLYNDCAASNTTIYSDNLSNELSNCKNELKVKEDKLNNISYIIHN